MSAALMPLVCALLWLLAAIALPFLREPRRLPALWALILVGVPLLGWLTLLWGPGAGVLGLALGLAAMLRPLKRPGPTNA